VEGGAFYFYHNDHLGTPQKLTGMDGLVAWSAVYVAFGEAVVDASSSVVNNLRFPGQYFDYETENHFSFFRFFNPRTGRFNETDALAEWKRSPYIYAQSNPIFWIDPLGLYDIAFFIDHRRPTGSKLYPAWVILIDPNTNGEIARFKGSIEPDQGRERCKGKCTRIAKGEYNYKTGLFPNNPRANQKRYKALWVGTVDSIGPNPNNRGKRELTGVWIHKGYLTSTGSEGCLTIPLKDWDEFIKLIHAGGGAGKIFNFID
jgi:RHS repeat-associated protein